MARLGVPAAYAGAWSTWTAGLKNGGVGAARAEGPRTPSRVTAKRAPTMARGSVRRIVGRRAVGARDMRVAPETDGFSAEYLIEMARFSKTGTSLLRDAGIVKSNPMRGCGPPITCFTADRRAAELMAHGDLPRRGHHG